MSSDISQENLYNYKGKHYEIQEKETYYEHGAHFSFKELCSKLNKLLNQQKQENTLDSKSNSKFTNYNQTNFNEFTNMHMKEKADKILTSFANKTMLINKNSRNNNMSNNPKSRNITTNIFKYSSEINPSKNDFYKKYSKQNPQTGTENFQNNAKEDKLKEKILKNFFLNSQKNSSSKNKINSSKTRNKQKNLQLYLTYSNKNVIENKNINDYNATKEQFHKINTVKINHDKLQSKNEKLNIYMSYDMSKTAKKNIYGAKDFKANKLSNSQSKNHKPRSSSSRKDYTEENWIKSTFHNNNSDSLARENSMKHYNELDNLSKKKPFLCFTNLKSKNISRNIKQINPTITLETQFEKNNSHSSSVYRSISHKKSENRPANKVNFLDSYYLNTTTNKSQNKSSVNKTLISDKSKINFDAHLFKKSNSDHLKLKKTYEKMSKANFNNYSQKINLEKANIIHFYNFKNDLNALFAKSKEYPKENSTHKNSYSYYKPNLTRLAKSNLSSEHSIINPRKFSNASQNEIYIYNLNKSIIETNKEKIKKNTNLAAHYSNNINYNLSKLNFVKFEGGGAGRENINNNSYKYTIVPPSVPLKKDGSRLNNYSGAAKNGYCFVNNIRSKIINTSSSLKKNSNKLNFSNQNLDYKIMKNDFSDIRKKSPNSNFKMISQNIIDINNLKKEVNLKFSEFNIYKDTEIKEDTRKNIKNIENSSDFSTKKNNQSGFSVIKNVKFNINNNDKIVNNQLNSENSIGVYTISILQTNSNLSSNNPYLETKFTYNANNSNSAYVNTNQNIQCGNPDYSFNNKTLGYKNFDKLNLSPKKGQRVKLLNNIKKKENIFKDINKVVIKEGNSSLNHNRSFDINLNNLGSKKKFSKESGGNRNIKFLNNPQKKIY